MTARPYLELFSVPLRGAAAAPPQPAWGWAGRAAGSGREEPSPAWGGRGRHVIPEPPRPLRPRAGSRCGPPFRRQRGEGAAAPCCSAPGPPLPHAESRAAGTARPGSGAERSRRRPRPGRPPAPPGLAAPLPHGRGPAAAPAPGRSARG